MYYSQPYITNIHWARVDESSVHLINKHKQAVEHPSCGVSRAAHHSDKKVSAPNTYNEPATTNNQNMATLPQRCLFCTCVLTWVKGAKARL